MSIQFVQQQSRLSRFRGVDEEDGEALAEQVWSDAAWATAFAEALTAQELTLAWDACTVYLAGQSYDIPAGNYTFTADPDYSQSIVIWLDDSSPDNLTIDITLLDGEHEPESAPTAGGGILSLAWGSIPAAGSEIALKALYHEETT